MDNKRRLIFLLVVLATILASFVIKQNNEVAVAVYPSLPAGNTCTDNFEYCDEGVGYYVWKHGGEQIDGACVYDFTPEGDKSCGQESGANSCPDDFWYCDQKEGVMVWKHGGEMSNGECAYDFTVSDLDTCGTPPAGGTEPLCNEDIVYCDERVGVFVKKHGGRWDSPEQQCIYDFTQQGKCTDGVSNNPSPNVDIIRLNTFATPRTGYCSKENLGKFFPKGTFQGIPISEVASKVCLAESSGVSNASSFSGDYGLFQINQTHVGKNFGSVTPGSVEQLKDPDVNIKVAVALSRGGTNWRPWSVAYQYACVGQRRVNGLGFIPGLVPWHVGVC